MMIETYYRINKFSDDELEKMATHLARMAVTHHGHDCPVVCTYCTSYKATVLTGKLDDWEDDEWHDGSMWDDMCDYPFEGVAGSEYYEDAYNAYCDMYSEMVSGAIFYDTHNRVKLRYTEVSLEVRVYELPCCEVERHIITSHKVDD